MRGIAIMALQAADRTWKSHLGRRQQRLGKIQEERHAENHDEACAGSSGDLPAKPASSRDMSRRSGGSLVLDGADEGSEDGSASATGNGLRDYAAHAQIARLRSGQHRREQ